MKHIIISMIICLPLYGALGQSSRLQAIGSRDYGPIPSGPGDKIPFEQVLPESLQSQIVALAINKNGDLLAGCGMWDNYSVLRSRDRGRTWKSVGPPGVYVKDLITNVEGWVYASTDLSSGSVPPGTEGLYRSKDYGDTWELLIGRKGTGVPRYVQNGSIAVSPSGDYFLGTVRDTVWRSLNGDSTWIPLTNGLPSPGFNPVPVGKFLFFDGDIYVKCSTGFYDPRNGIYKSTDNGDSWAKSDSGIAFGMPIETLLAHNGLLFAGGTNYADESLPPPWPTIYTRVYVSKDTGASWVATGNSISTHRLRVNAQGHIFAGTDGLQQRTDGGLFRSTNEGTTWDYIALSGQDTWDVAFDDSGYIYVGSASQYRETAGLYRSLYPVTSVDHSQLPVPERFVLYQNCPNPFNPSTTIKYELPKTSMVRLNVYDILGREVSVLVNEERNVGIYEVRFDGSTLSSGVYFCRLQAGDFVQTRKLLLAK